ncbi:MAG: alkylmercury lyase family protein [Thermoplasmata archaeon]|nr:alkylmercury lyase family protein [Thermoplasmata archaeon]
MIPLLLVLDRPIRVESFCHACEGAVGFDLRGGHTTSPGAADVVVSLFTAVARWYDDLISTGSNTMVFFHRDHLASWQAEHPQPMGAAFSVDQTVQVVNSISRNRAT